MKRYLDKYINSKWDGIIKKYQSYRAQSALQATFISNVCFLLQFLLGLKISFQLHLQLNHVSCIFIRLFHLFARLVQLQSNFAFRAVFHLSSTYIFTLITRDWCFGKVGINSKFNNEVLLRFRTNKIAKHNLRVPICFKIVMKKVSVVAATDAALLL